MTTYAYVALDGAGKKRTGYVEAMDERSAIAQVTNEGRFVVEIKAESGGAKTRTDLEAKVEKKKTRTTKADVALFSRRMADLAEAGLPLDRVLQVLAEQSESVQLSQASLDALEEVRGGIPVSQALAKHPKLFPTVYTQTLAAGEASGQFSESAKRLADLQENEVARRSLVISALIYPAVLTGTAVFVVVFLLTFVVPRLAGVFEDLGDELPLPTQILLATTGFLTQNGLLIIGASVAGFIAFRAWAKTPGGGLVKDRFLMNAPMFGSIVKKSVVSRYARVLGTLVHGGVPILNALNLAGMASGNRVFLSTSGQVEDDVREGRPIAAAMKDAGAFPPVLTHMVAIGEETGDLPKMLSRVADSLDFEVEQGLRRLTSMLEPIIVLVMGAFVAFVVLSVMLPIFQAQSLVK